MAVVRRQRHLPQERGADAGGARVPAQRLLVETDAPYLSPQPVRGQRNRPANVTMTAQAIAAQRRVGYGELERDIELAAAAVFGW